MPSMFGSPICGRPEDCMPCDVARKVGPADDCALGADGCGRAGVAAECAEIGHSARFGPGEGVLPRGWARYGRIFEIAAADDLAAGSRVSSPAGAAAERAER